MRLARGGKLRGPFVAQPLEAVVTAGVHRHLALLEMQDVIDDIVEQVALMADHDDRRAIAAQEIFQPQRRFKIEMVRRLVEQQQIRSRKQQRGEGNAHPPAARIAVERTALHLVVEAESGEDAGGAGRRAIGIDRIQPLVNCAEAVGLMAMLGLVEQRGALAVGGQHRLDRRGPAGGGVLGDVADPGVARHIDAAAVGIDQPGDHLHQRRLAGTVAADQADSATRRQRRRGAVEDGASAEAHGDAGEIEHGRAR